MCIVPHGQVHSPTWAGASFEEYYTEKPNSWRITTHTEVTPLEMGSQQVRIKTHTEVLEMGSQQVRITTHIEVTPLEMGSQQVRM